MVKHEQMNFDRTFHLKTGQRYLVMHTEVHAKSTIYAHAFLVFPWSQRLCWRLCLLFTTEMFFFLFQQTARTNTMLLLFANTSLFGISHLISKQCLKKGGHLIFLCFYFLTCKTVQLFIDTISYYKISMHTNIE